MLILLRWQVAALSLSHVAEATILVLGDSYAMKSGTDLANACPGKTVINRGVCDSTAAQWGSGTCSDESYAWYAFKGDTAGKACSAEDAFSYRYGSGYSHVWLSVGGNDFMYSGCLLPRWVLTRSVRSAVAAVRDAAAKGVKILMIGYCIPQGPIPQWRGLVCAKPSLIVDLNKAIEAGCKAESSCTYIDSTDACGGDGEHFSDGRYFVDDYHPNEKGYSLIFHMPKVQEFFGCNQANVSARVGAPPGTVGSFNHSLVVNKTQKVGGPAPDKSSGVDAKLAWAIIGIICCACCCCGVLFCGVYGAPCLWRCGLLMGLLDGDAEAALTTALQADAELQLDQTATTNPPLVQFSLPAPIVYARPTMAPATLPLMNPRSVYRSQPHVRPPSRLQPVNYAPVATTVIR